jgi:hypothetical protein
MDFDASDSVIAHVVAHFVRRAAWIGIFVVAMMWTAIPIMVAQDGMGPFSRRDRPRRKPRLIRLKRVL